MNAKELELQRLTVEWAELPQKGSGHWFLHVALRHGNDEVTEEWYTGHQAAEVVKVAGQRP